MPNKQGFEGFIVTTHSETVTTSQGDGGIAFDVLNLPPLQDEGVRSDVVEFLLGLLGDLPFRLSWRTPIHTYRTISEMAKVDVLQ